MDQSYQNHCERILSIRKDLVMSKNLPICLLLLYQLSHGLLLRMVSECLHLTTNKSTEVSGKMDYLMGEVSLKEMVGLTKANSKMGIQKGQES